MEILTNGVEGSESETVRFKEDIINSNHLFLLDFGGTVASGTVDIYVGVDGLSKLALADSHTITAGEISANLGVIVLTGYPATKIKVVISALTGTNPTITVYHERGQ